MMDDRITVPMVANLIGVVLTNKIAWSVGSEIASMYFDKFGEQPPKDNRPKTNGEGSHCFALYPPSWKPIIEKAIFERVEYEKTQGTLFDEAQ